jgi:hypothetical protein
MPQVPPPPHAEGKNTLRLPRVVSKVLPDSTSKMSPLMSSLTGPEGANRAFACRSIVTKRMVTRVKMKILQRIVDVNIAKP